MNFNVCEMPAVKALGSLFKNTNAYLWDRGSSKRQKATKGGYSEDKDERWGHSGYKDSWGNKNNEKWGHSSYKNDEKWGHSGYENNERWSHSDLYVIGRSSQRKCNKTQTSCDLKPNVYMAKRSRNINIYTNSISSHKKGNRTNSNGNLSVSSDDAVLQKDSPGIRKYWAQRYQLFNKFDDGIKMDEEGWYSVTPEAIAKHQASRCGNGEIIDLFTGVGGNAIQFAKESKNVIAIDIDANKIDYARHNATIYGVEDKINFVNANCLALAPKLKADTVFMSPPWGGPNYSKVKKFDMNTMLQPCDGQSLFNLGKEIAPKVVMYLPKNTDVNQLARLALSTTPSWSLEVENNYLNGRLKAITAYFSNPSKSIIGFSEDRETSA